MTDEPWCPKHDQPATVSRLHGAGIDPDGDEALVWLLICEECA